MNTINCINKEKKREEITHTCSICGNRITFYKTERMIERIECNKCKNKEEICFILGDK